MIEQILEAPNLALEIHANPITVILPKKHTHGMANNPDVTLRTVPARIGVGFTYLSKAENGKLAFADFPGEALIVKLAKATPTNCSSWRRRFRPSSRKGCWNDPEAFRTLAGLDDDALDVVMGGLGGEPPRRRKRRS